MLCLIGTIEYTIYIEGKVHSKTDYSMFVMYCLVQHLGMLGLAGLRPSSKDTLRFDGFYLSP
jgi:hypothetical protein